jgi:hypothetical protein
VRAPAGLVTTPGPGGRDRRRRRRRPHSALLTGGPGVKAPFDRAAFLGFRSLDLPPSLKLGARWCDHFLYFLWRFLSHKSCDENYESFSREPDERGQSDPSPS